jgi:alcohol dehydrogenase class IV
VARFEELAGILTAKPSAGADEGIAWLRSLCDRLNVPRLSTYGFTSAHSQDLIAKSIRSSSMRGNPIDLTAQELEAILEQAG